jgi:hypothetical protein
MTAPAESDDDIWGSLWHGAAWRAYAELVAEQGFPPDSEATRRRAYDYYERALAEQNRRKSRPETVAAEPAGAGD